MLCHGAWHPRAEKRRDCRENDLFALNAKPCEFSVERVFSLDYVGVTFPRLVAGLRFFNSNEALACGFHPL
jgi:hypothetical protein